MSNDLVAPGAGAPSKRFQERPAEPETIGSQIGIGLGFSVVGPSGKQFKLHYQGSSYMLTAGAATDYFDMIILRGGEAPSHTWYKQGYSPGNESPPDCSSTDGIGPDDDSKEPQATYCQLCEKHEWKIQPNGRKGRACADSLRLAVLIVSQNLVEAAVGHQINEPVMFRVPAASMKGLTEFMNNVKQRHGGSVASYGYVTRVRMRQDVAHAQFTYQVIAWLTDEQVDRMEEIREDPVAYRILGKTAGGHSLVRQAANGPPPEPAQDVLPPLPPQDDIAAKLAAERQARIDAVRQGKILEVKKAEEVLLPAQAPTPMEEVEEAPADMAALVAAMRPPAPRG